MMDPEKIHQMKAIWNFLKGVIKSEEGIALQAEQGESELPGNEDIIHGQKEPMIAAAEKILFFRWKCQFG